MKRRLLNLLTALSLLVCVAVCVLWVRSYWVAERVGYRRTDVARARFAGDSVASARGRVGLTRVRATFALPEVAAGHAKGLADGWYYATFEPFEDRRPGRPFWQRMGFGLRRDSPRSLLELSRQQVEVHVPYWVLAATTSVPPSAWCLVRRGQRLRARRGLCPRCGYDLRATPGRCPECGEAVAGRASQAPAE